MMAWSGAMESTRPVSFPITAWTPTLTLPLSGGGECGHFASLGEGGGDARARSGEMGVGDGAGQRISGIRGLKTHGGKQTFHHCLNLGFVRVTHTDNGFLDVVGRVFRD